MVFAAYALYALLTSFALLRGQRMGAALSGRLAWRASIPIMILLPVTTATALTMAISNQSDSAAPWVLAFGYSAGALIFLSGFGFLMKLSPSSGLLLRAIGWSVVAGVTLIPATLVIFSPLAGFLAFSVPRANR
jgi:hypothetical protein